MVLGGPVEGRGDDLTLDRPLHVGDLLGALVDEHDHEVDLGVVGGDGVGDRLQDHRLARLRRRDDETALALADRGDQVDDARRQVLRVGFEPQPVLRIQRRQLVELDALARFFRIDAVDRVETHERVELLATLAFTRLTHRAGDGVALAHAVPTHLRERDVDVVGAGQVARGAHERVVVEDVEDAGNRHENVVIGNLRLGLESLARWAVAVALAEPAATPPVAELVVVSRAARMLLALLATLAALAALATALLVAALTLLALLSRLALATLLVALAAALTIALLTAASSALTVTLAGTLVTTVVSCGTPVAAAALGASR